MKPDTPIHEGAARSLACLDLTDLGDGATDQRTVALCAAALSPRNVAAVCLSPRFVPLTRRELARSAVRIATVASGDDRPAEVRAAIRKALDEGADEVDVVIPYRDLGAGNKSTVTRLLRIARAAIPAPGIFQVILETGAYPAPSLFVEAGRLSGCA